MAVKSCLVKKSTAGIASEKGKNSIKAPKMAERTEPRDQCE
jgi:hypothetical protein